MSAEKKSLKRFLFIYIISTLLLAGIGEWFYFKSKYHSQIDAQVSELNSELKLFLAENKGMLRNLRFSGTKKFPKTSGFKIAVFKNGNYMFGNFKPSEIFLNKEYWIKDGYIYYVFTMPKRWAKIDILISKSVNKNKLEELKKQIVVFNLFLFVFVIFISFMLGKIFLKPLKSSVEMLEEFIRDATHEMNTPISVILTNIEMLKMKNIETKELKRIEFSAKRLEKIFRDLTFARLHHKQKREIETINIKEILNERITIFQTLLENKNIKLQKNINDLYLEADREDIIRLTDNMLSNAVKYSPSGEVVIITLKNGVLQISNKGKIENISKITRKFYRENSNEGGFGLGLYIIKKICDYYGYDLKIENENGFVKTSVIFNH